IRRKGGSSRRALPEEWAARRVCAPPAATRAAAILLLHQRRIRPRHGDAFDAGGSDQLLQVLMHGPPPAGFLEPGRQPFMHGLERQGTALGLAAGAHDVETEAGL